MAFTPTPTPPATNASVTIKFAGLMLLKPGAGDSCEIGIHRLSETHSFQAMVIVSKPDRPPSLVRLLTGPLTGQLGINFIPPTASTATTAPVPGVRAFIPTTTLFDRSSNGNDELDFRWALNMREIQGTDVDFNGDARPIAKLNTGILYTSSLSNKELNPQLVKGAIPPRPLHRFSADLAAAINLPDRSHLEITWDEDGETREYRLPRRVDRHEPRTTYTVVLLNDPPITTAAAHDEFAYYYEVLEHSGASIRSDQQFRLEFISGPTTDEIPCMPIVI